MKAVQGTVDMGAPFRRAWKGQEMVAVLDAVAPCLASKESLAMAGLAGAGLFRVPPAPPHCVDPRWVSLVHHDLMTHSLASHLRCAARLAFHSCFVVLLVRLACWWKHPLQSHECQDPSFVLGLLSPCLLEPACQHQTQKLS